MPAIHRERLIGLTIDATREHSELKHVVDKVDPSLWPKIFKTADTLEDTAVRVIDRAIHTDGVEALLEALVERCHRREFVDILETIRAPALIAHHELPSQPVGPDWPTELLGRSPELDELHRALVVDRKNLVAVHGLPGIGKTALVEEFARLARSKHWFPGGVVISRAGTEDIDRRVTAQRAYSREFPDTIFDALPAERFLLVFDNLEDDADITTILDRRSVVSCDCALLLTIMKRSALPPGTHVVELGPLTDELACAVIEKRAGKPTGPLDAGALDDAVEWAGGIPLLLHIAAGHLADPFFQQLGWSWRQIIDDLQDHDPADQEPVAERYAKVFERIDRALERAPRARSLLLAATLFHVSGFSKPALYQVADVKLNDTAPLHLLHELALIRCIDQPAERWAVHSYMHKVASEAFARDPSLQSQRAGQRHRFLAAMAARLFASSGFQAMRSYESSIRRAFEELSEDDIAFLWDRFRAAHKTIEFSAIDLVLPAAQRRQLWSGLLTCAYRQLPNGASAEGDLLRGICLLNLGRADLHDQQLIEAKHNLDRAIHALRPSATSEPRLLADALLCQSDVLRADNDVGKAMTYLEEAISFLQSSPRELGSSHRKLGMCFERSGDFRSAHQHLQKALEIHEQPPKNADWRNDIAYDSCRLGTILLHMGRVDEAMHNLEKARALHTKKVGPDSAFVAYDLNRLGQAYLAKGDVAGALELQHRARTIHTRVSGKDSTETAIDALRLAEALLEAGNPPGARHYVAQAETIYANRRRTESPHYGYVLALGARIALAERRIADAVELAGRAVALVSGRQSVNIHRPLAQLVHGEALLASDRVHEAVEMLFEARDGFAQFGMLRDFKAASRLLDAALLRRDTSAWDRSAVEYAGYLESFPDGLHGRVASATVQLLADELERTSPGPGAWVVDLCCGTGILSAALIAAGVPVNVLGLDCAGMVEQARLSMAKLAAPPGTHRFVAMQGDWRADLVDRVRSLPGKVVAIHLGLAIFQFGVRERHLLLQAIRAAVDADTLFVFSTYAADFQFPDGCGTASANELNPFKQRLFDAWKIGGWNPPPQTYEEALRPVFPKDSVGGLRQLLACHGFALQTDPPRPIRIERSGADRVAFSRLDAVSEKVFGKRLAAPWWTAAARDLASYSDVTWATVLQARRTTACVPKYLFLPPWDDASPLSRIEYTPAVAIEGPERRILFAKRGEAARDFRGAWSLPSAKADSARGLEDVLRERLAQTLALSDVSLQLVAIRPALRKGPDGLWVNNLCVYLGQSTQVARPDGQKYSEIAHWPVEEFLSRRFRFCADAGDCVKAYWDWLQLTYASAGS